MQVVKQLSILLKNRPGTLADLCTHLTNEGINIVGFMVADTIDHAVIRMVVDEPLKATHLLGNSGLLVVETDVLMVDLKNEPGQLAKLSTKLSDNSINLEYAYGGISMESSSGVLYLRPSNTHGAFELLEADYS